MKEKSHNEATATSCPDEGDDYSDDGRISDVSREEEDATLQESRAFLPVVRVLINCWAFILQNLFIRVCTIIVRPKQQL